MDKQKIRIFKINDMEWWVGESLEQIVEYYCKNVCDDEDAIEDPYEVPDKAMKRLIIRETDTMVKRTFREELDKMIAEGQEFPCCFAAEDW